MFKPEILISDIDLSGDVSPEDQLPTLFDKSTKKNIEHNLILQRQLHPFIKEDYKQIASKDLYQFNSDIRIDIKGVSAGYGIIWDLDDEVLILSSIGYSKKKTINKWELETENDLYFTKPLTYQTESRILYKITDKIGLGISGNYINLLEGYDYSARAVITIKFGEAE